MGEGRSGLTLGRDPRNRRPSRLRVGPSRLPPGGAAHRRPPPADPEPTPTPRSKPCPSPAAMPRRSSPWTARPGRASPASPEGWPAPRAALPRHGRDVPRHDVVDARRRGRGRRRPPGWRRARASPLLAAGPRPERPHDHPRRHRRVRGRSAPRGHRCRERRRRRTGGARSGSSRCSARPSTAAASSSRAATSARSSCPDATVKVFLTASAEARAARRSQELTGAGHADAQRPRRRPTWRAVTPSTPPGRCRRSRRRPTPRWSTPRTSPSRTIDEVVALAESRVAGGTHDHRRPESPTTDGVLERGGLEDSAWARAAAAELGIDDDVELDETPPAGPGRRRPAERRQVDAGQPDPRPP